MIFNGYDLYSKNGEQTILPGSYCSLYWDCTYQILWIKDFLHLCNKVAQFFCNVFFTASNVAALKMLNTEKQYSGVKEIDQDWNCNGCNHWYSSYCMVCCLSIFTTVFYNYCSCIYCSTVCGNDLPYVHQEDTKAVS